LNIRQWLSPKIFFLGILIGFSICIILGIIVSRHDKLHHFTRFFYGIQPQQQFFPTNFELLNTALHKVNKNKILVLIGGSSIFKGVGQNKNELWSLRLQKLLGDRFSVLNYAIDSATLPDFGGVAFRILKNHYHKIIFVSTCQVGGPASVDGQPIFNYLFWDGYYHHLFNFEKSEKKNILNIRKQEFKTAGGLETHIASFMDSLFFFKPLWTWVGYHSFFTVWNDLSYDHPFQARKDAQDSIIDFKSIQKDQKNNPISFQLGIDFINRIVDGSVDMIQYSLRIKPGMAEREKQTLDQAFPRSFRQNILCVVTNENPDHLAQVSAKIQLENKYLLQYTHKLLIDLGYNAIQIGDDFVANDFLDARHFAKSGGEKTADAVALQVKKIAKNLYYL